MIFKTNFVKLSFLMRDFSLCFLILFFFSSCINRIVSGYVPTVKSKSLYQKIDIEENLTYTVHKLFLKKPIFTLANKNRFYLYIVSDSESKWLRIVFEYNGIDRHFFDKILLKNKQSKNLEWNFSNKNINSNNRHGGVVHERKDLLVTEEQYQNLMKLLNPRTIVEYRFSSNYNEEYLMTKKSLKAALELIEYYESMYLSVLR